MSLLSRSCLHCIVRKSPPRGDFKIPIHKHYSFFCAQPAELEILTLREDITITDWNSGCMGGAAVNNNSCASSIGKCCQNCIFHKVKCWYIVFFKHDLYQLFSLFFDIPL